MKETVKAIQFSLVFVDFVLHEFRSQKVHADSV